MRISDWSSDVCSSDLARLGRAATEARIVTPLGRVDRLHVLALGDEAGLAGEDAGVDPVRTARAVGSQLEIAFAEVLRDGGGRGTLLGGPDINLGRHRPAPVLSAAAATRHTQPEREST